MANKPNQDDNSPKVEMFWRVLIVEDSVVWQRILKDMLKAVFEKTSPRLKFKTRHEISLAETRRDARDLVSRHAFHGATLDRRVPEERGNVAHDNVGREMAKTLRGLDRTSVMSIYTAYADIDPAQKAGGQHIAYVSKSVQTKPEENAMLAIDYAVFFVNRVLLRYIPQVLEEIKKSGFKVLRDSAHAALEAYSPILVHSEHLAYDAQPGFVSDDVATTFLIDFFKFQERFLEAFVGLTLDIARAEGLDCALSPEKTSEELEGWATETWDSIERQSTPAPVVSRLRDYFLIPSDESFSAHFMPAFALIRKIHDKQPDESKPLKTDEIEKLRPAMFRVLDLAALFARLQMIHQPRPDRADRIAFGNLNAERSIRSDIAFADSIPTPINASEPLYTMLPGGSELIPLGTGIGVTRGGDNYPRLVTWKDK